MLKYLNWLAMIESTVSIQWLRRYKIFFFVGLLLLIIQLLLSYSLPIFGTSDDIYNLNVAAHNHLPNERNAQKNRAAFHQLFQEQNLPFDDDEEEEGDISNSNLIVNLKDVVNGLNVQKNVASSAKGSMLNQQMISTNTNINYVPNSNLATISDDKQHTLNTNLKLGDLKFKPVCDIIAKEAISAVYRAQTQLCKETIINITCAIQNGKFYPNNLPNYCPHEPFSENRPLGCFRDDKKFRTLSGYYINFKTTNTPKKCIQLCLQSGFVYAGVQYS